MATTLLVVKNRAYSKLATALTSGATSMEVTAGEGALFPSTYPFHLTIEDEIVSVTARSTDTMTIVRARQSTSAVAHNNLTRVALNITAKSITDLNTAVNTIEADVPTYVATGDMRYASAAATGAILSIAADNYILAVATDVPAWKSPADILADISPLTTRGDMMFRNATLSTRLAKGADNTILAMGANDPEWKTPAVILGDLTGANLDVGAFDVRGQTVTADGLTATRVVFAGASGVLSGSTNMTFVTDTLTVSKIAAFIMTGMIDINGQAFGDGTDELLTFTEAADAVNHIEITNAATGERPIISAVGDDTDIPLCLQPKGIGHIDIPFTLPSTAGEELDGIFISVDSSAQAATAVFQAFHVETTGTPAGAVEGVTTVGKVAPVHQHVTSPVTPSQTEFAGRKTGGGSSWVDAIDGIEIFVVNSDSIFVGAATQFDEIEIIFGTAATKSVSPTFYYSTGASSWTQFFPSDGTAGFTSSGNISWTLGDISGLWTGDGDPASGAATVGYWIRIDRTRVADPGSPNPNSVKIALATEYEWDKDGGLTIAQITTAIIYGAGSDYLRIGDANTTQHSLNSEDDLMVTGDLEVNGTFHPNAITLGGAVAGGDQAFTGVGDMTFTNGSIIAAVDGAGTTLLIKAGGLSGITFITLTSQSGGTDTMSLGAWTAGGTITVNGQTFSGDAHFDDDIMVDDIIWVGGTNTNAKMTQGITLRQGGNDDELLSLKSSDVAHGRTTITETDTYGYFKKAEASSGGIDITGIKDANGSAGFAFKFTGILAEAADTTKSSSGIGIVHFNAWIADGGTSIAVPGSGQNVFVIGSGSNAVSILDAEGDLWLAGGLTTAGVISQDDTTNSTSATTGSIHTDGGIGIAENLYCAKAINTPDGMGSDGEQLTSGGDNTAMDWAAAGSLLKFKDIHEPLNPSNALDAILLTTPMYFHYQRESDDGGRTISTHDFETEYAGLIAEEAPWAMHHNGTIFNPVSAFGYTVGALQALNEKIETVEEKIERLESELAELRGGA